MVPAAHDERNHTISLCRVMTGMGSSDQLDPFLPLFQACTCAHTHRAEKEDSEFVEVGIEPSTQGILNLLSLLWWAKPRVLLTVKSKFVY